MILATLFVLVASPALGVWQKTDSPLSTKPSPTGRWSFGSDHPEETLDHAGVVIGGKLYAIGGKRMLNTHEAFHVATAFVYDPEEDKWQKLPDRPGPAVENAAVTQLDGKVIVAGGSTEAFTGSIKLAHEYDPNTGNWSTLPPMQVARGGVTAQSLNGKVYVIGGMDDDSTSLSSVESYDPVEKTWRIIGSLNVRRDNPGSAVLNGELYVFGGRTMIEHKEIEGNLNTVEKYDPSTDSWHYVAPMPTGRRTMVVGTIGGKAQLIGGEKMPVSGASWSANEEYDPKTNQWRVLQPMITPRHGAAGGTIGDRVVVVGGGPTGGRAFSKVTEIFGYGENL
mmetsp:Transcript_10526/g.14596  ORF Transcript_10526/g.14596 Transcript_10526/m.14596 type:complete len:337 (+) Transcript_10526:149-1159(+)|eukprot:CAMPEP_0185252552 /NCGR_PEP_ID=MMETSP1359-20130426/1603_1 /TAXON_ID=552665 /ORGANISM="Bigelowiella longifila, Strain CCMP242" /LENGTH=336 /DNA_ID=CAMNT_0027834743 /DNA_START=62 /DNA_END=1072 /DNA_ORIENTATION=-